MDLALNNLQRLICHKTNQTKSKKKQQTYSSVKCLEYKRKYFDIKYLVDFIDIMLIVIYANIVSTLLKKEFMLVYVFLLILIW